MRGKTVLAALAAGFVVLTAVAVNFPCGTYVIAGSVRNSSKEVLKGDPSTFVLAVSTNGDVLAESVLGNPYGTAAGYNCRLCIPLSTAATEKTAAVGDEVKIVMVSSESAMSTLLNSVSIAAANEVTNIVLQAVDVVRFVNPTNSEESVFIAREYLDAIAPWLGYFGYETYDPFADWDADGSFNYQEYLHGTSPFDPLDKLQILKAMMTAAGDFGITYEYVGGHVYAIQASPTLTNPAWATRSFKVTETSAPQSQVAYEGNGEGGGVATNYVTPAVGQRQEFFRLEGK